MSSKLFFKHFIIIFIIGLFISNLPANAKEKEFEFIAPDQPTPSNKSGGNIFDLLTTPAQNQQSGAPAQQWGNNPFAKQQVMEVGSHRLRPAPTPAPTHFEGSFKQNHRLCSPPRLLFILLN